MPPIASQYTFADFLQRLERSPVAHMSPLYHEHRVLFVNRPDMLSKAIFSISWERGLALLQAAYYTQPVAAESYRALLARMLRHNRQVEKIGAGQPVSWQAAMHVMNEAIRTHGTTLPTRVAVSTLRLLAPHRQWQIAIDILKLSQVNEKLTKPMLLDAAHACATPTAWPHALKLLMHLHAQDPPLLYNAIQSMRPLGTTALTSSTAAQALLPGAQDNNAPPTPTQQHILSVLNSVVGAVPHNIALHDPLCVSYLTHLLASTTLSPELKVRRATAAMTQLPWTAALQLLSDMSEPTLLTAQEWAKVQDTVLLQGGDDSSSAKRRSGLLETSGEHKKKLKGKRGMKKKSEGTVEPEVREEGVNGESAVGLSRTMNEATKLHTTGNEEADDPTSGLSDAMRHKSNITPATRALLSRLQLLRASPSTSAAMIAVMVEKLPTPEMAVAFIRSCAAQLAEPNTTPASTSFHANGGSDGRSFADLRGLASPLPIAATSATAGSAAATRHPVVVHALLCNCARHKHGWAIAANVLLEHSGAQVASPTELISALVHQLRQAKQVSLVVRLLHEHIIPSGSVLTARAWEEVLECALAHNRAIQLRSAEVGEKRGGKLGDQRDQYTGVASNRSSADELQLHRGVSLSTPHLSGIHWVSALSWVLNRQAAPREARIHRTGTGPSLGATPRHPTAVVPLEQPLSPKMLSLLINICVQGGCPQAALHAMGYARRVDKTELPHTAQIRALLYCMQYDRPFEAETIVAHLAKKEGEDAARPLQHLLKLMAEGKHNGKT